MRSLRLLYGRCRGLWHRSSARSSCTGDVTHSSPFDQILVTHIYKTSVFLARVNWDNLDHTPLINPRGSTVARELDQLNGAVLGRAQHLMFPEADDPPSGAFKPTSLLDISVHIGPQLGSPELGSSLGPTVMDWAAMPEASINEDSQPSCCDHEIRAAILNASV